MDLPTRPGLSDDGVAELIHRFLSGRSPRTVQAYRADLDNFARVRARPLVEAVAELLAADADGGCRVLRGFAAQLRREGRAAATIDRRVSTLRLLVRQARDGGLVGWSLAGGDG